MKIEVKIHHPSGDVGSYPVHKLVRNDDGWTASYVTVKAGRHEGRKVKIEEGKAELEVNMEQEKPELNPGVIFDRNGIEILKEVAYLGAHNGIAIRKFNTQILGKDYIDRIRLSLSYKAQAEKICNGVFRHGYDTFKPKASSLMAKAAYAIRQAESVQEYIKNEVEK